jgi:hypothetical protein
MTGPPNTGLDAARAESIVRRFRGQPVLVVGDIIPIASSSAA